MSSYGVVGASVEVHFVGDFEQNVKVGREVWEETMLLFRKLVSRKAMNNVDTQQSSYHPTAVSGIVHGTSETLGN